MFFAVVDNTVIEVPNFAIQSYIFQHLQINSIPIQIQIFIYSHIFKLIITTKLWIYGFISNTDQKIKKSNN